MEEKINVATLSLEEETVKPTEITLSDGNFPKPVELRAIDESWLAKPVFPTDKTLAFFANLAYEDNLRETIFSSDLEQALLAFQTYKDELEKGFFSSNKELLDESAIDSYKNNLNESLRKVKEEWKLLTTARNKSDGYFGAAFWNLNEQQLVISHRGTKLNADVILADIEGIIYSLFTSQINSACTFVAHVLRQLSHLKGFKQNGIQITITGHSLGAWLAQITTFSAEYLTVDQGQNKFRLKSEEDVAYHVHCVGFESPGCRRMLTKLSEMYHCRYEKADHNFWTNLDIALYLTRPNMVNTCCKHVGKLYQIDIPHLKRNILWSINIARNCYLLHYHSIVSIVMAMCNDNRVMVIEDWPLVTLPERIKNEGSKPSKLLRSAITKLCKQMPGLIYDYYFTSGQEVNEFWNRANKINDNSPEADRNTEWAIKLHYKINEIEESECNLNSFSKVEQLFLFCWPNETSLRVNIKYEIRNEFPNFKLDKYDSLFENFFLIENDYKHIKCVNFKVIELINFTKQLFRFFHEPKKFVQNLVKKTRASVSICKKFSDSYLQRVIVEHLEFKDTIDLEAFLNSTSDLNAFVIKTKFKFEIQRIYSILRLNQINYIFLDLTQLTHLNNYLYLSETIESISDHVLVLNCQQENLNEHEVILLTTLLNNSKTLKTIIVVQSGEAEFAESKIKAAYKYNVRFIEHDNNVRFSDLTPESNTWFNQIIKDKVKLQGKNIDLLSFIGQRDVLDSNIFAELIKKNKIFEIGCEPMKLCQLEASYAKRLKFIKTERLINALKDHSNGRKNKIIVITASDEINVKQFFELLKVKDENVIKQIEKHTFEVENINIEYNNYYNTIIILFKSGEEAHFKSVCCSNSDKIVYWLEIINQQFYLHQIFDPDFYVKRNLFHNKCIKRQAVFDLSASERFVLSATESNSISEMKKIESQIIDKAEQLESKSENESEKDKLENKIKKNIFSTSDENEALNKFNEWCAEKSQFTAVHWLKVTDRQLVWKQSHHSISNLQRHIDESCSIEIDEQTLAKLNNNKVVVVVAEPGMGKSTTLTRLSEYKLDDNWVIRLNLRDFQDELSDLPNDYFEAEKASKAVVRFLLNVSRSNINCKLTIELLKFSLSRQLSRPLLILFDGYDEIDSTYQDKLIKLMKYLKEETFANLWITSRKHFTNKLEDELYVLSTTFKELNLDERKMFLKNFWQVRLKLELSDDEYKSTFGNEGDSLKLDKFQTFSDALLVKVDEVLNENMSKFMGIPLQMRLLAEGFLPEFEKYVKGGSDIAFDTLDVSHLYQRFIKIKYDIYLREKSAFSIRLNKESAEKVFSNYYNKIHQKLALKLLFPGKMKYLVTLEHSFSNKEFSIDSDAAIDLKRVGLLHSTLYSNELEFIHRTFAEYFVAEFILESLRKPINSQKFEALEQLLVVILRENYSHPVISNFLNEQITETDLTRVKTESFGRTILIHDSQFLKNVNLIKFFLSYFKNKVWLFEETFKSFLEFCISNNASTEIVAYILQLIKNHYDIVRKVLLKLKDNFALASRKRIMSIAARLLHQREEDLNISDFKLKEENALLLIIISAIKRYRGILKEVVIHFDVDVNNLRAVINDNELSQYLIEIKRDETHYIDKESITLCEINRLAVLLLQKYKIYRKVPLKSDFFSNLELLSRKSKPEKIILNIKQLMSFIETFKNLIKIAKTYTDHSCKQKSQFLVLVKSDKNIRQLLILLEKHRLRFEDSVLSLFRVSSRPTLIESVRDGDLENAEQIFKSYEPIAQFSLYMYYISFCLKPQEHKELDDNQERFLFFLFDFYKSDPITSMHLFSLFCNSPPKYVNKLLGSVECQESKKLMKYFLNVVKNFNLILTEKKLERFCQTIIGRTKDKNINGLEDILDIVGDDSVTRKWIKAEIAMKKSRRKNTNSELEIFDFDFFKKLNGSFTFIQALNTITSNQLSINKMLSWAVHFPILFHLLILKCNYSNNVGLHFTNWCAGNVIYLILEFLWNHFPQTALYLALVIVNDGAQTLMYNAVRFNQLKILRLLFKILNQFPNILGHLILTPNASYKSCLHCALESKDLPVHRETLDLFLAKLNTNVKAMEHVLENFVSDEEEKLNLFETAEINNPGALLFFLNSLKVNDDMFIRFVLPADKKVKPAFYLASEKGCKELMDTLLSALKSEPDILLQLLQWTDPNSGQTVLHRAYERGYREIVEAILHSIRKQVEEMPIRLYELLSLKDKWGNTALDCAILSKTQIIKNKFTIGLRKKLVQSQIYKDFKVNYKYNECEGKQIERLQTLSKDLKNIPMVVYLLLIVAKSLNNVELMLALFEIEDLRLALKELGVSIDDYSYHLFHSAIERESIELVNKLIKKRIIDVNATNGFGFTPLMMAVSKAVLTKNTSIVQTLVVNGGANVFARDMNGQSAVSMTIDGNIHQILNYPHIVTAD